MLADFVVLSGQLDSWPRVEQTYVDGDCAYGCGGGSVAAPAPLGQQGSGGPAAAGAAATA
jgi:hypothetical protein